MKIICRSKYIIKRIMFKMTFLASFREFMALYVVKRALNKTDKEKMHRHMSVIRDLNLHYRLTDGTALGLYRDGDFIKHDDDIDIDIIDATEKQIKQIKRSIKMKIGREVIHKNLTQQIAFYDSEGFILDIVFWHRYYDRAFNYCERGFEREQDVKFFDNKIIFNFDDHDYFLPAPTEEWLIMRYGNDWRIPKTYKDDWKEECYDMKRIE